MGAMGRAANSEVIFRAHLDRGQQLVGVGSEGVF